MTPNPKKNKHRNGKTWVSGQKAGGMLETPAFASIGVSSVVGVIGIPFADKFGFLSMFSPPFWSGCASRGGFTRCWGLKKKKGGEVR